MDVLMFATVELTYTALESSPPRPGATSAEGDRHHPGIHDVHRDARSGDGICQVLGGDVPFSAPGPAEDVVAAHRSSASATTSPSVSEPVSMTTRKARWKPPATPGM